MTSSFPFELPGKSRYWGATVWPAAVFVGFALWGFVSMFGGRPVFALAPESEEPGPIIPTNLRETVG